MPTDDAESFYVAEDGSVAAVTVSRMGGDTELVEDVTEHIRDEFETVRHPVLLD